MNDKKLQEAAMDKYIKEKHTQEECIGFIDGFNVANSLSLTEIEGLKKENERLKLLIEKSHYTGYNDGKYNGNYKYTITESFNLFKSENNI